MAVVDRDMYYNARAQANQAAARREAINQELYAQKRKLAELNGQGGGLTAEDLTAMQQRFDRANQGFQHELDKLREDLGRQLGRQAVETRRVLDEIRSMAADNRRTLDAAVSKISELEKEMARQFKAIEAQLQEKRKTALFYYDQLTDLVAQIEKLSPEKYELLYPDQIKQNSFVLRSGVADVLSDIESRNYEAAIGLAQSRIPEALTLLGQMEFFHNRYLAQKRETGRQLEAFRKRLATISASLVSTLTIAGKEYRDDKGVSYWAKELYQKILEELAECERQFEYLTVTQDAEGLQFVSQELEQMELQLTDCEAIAANERQLHYECVDRAWLIAEALENHSDWVITQEPYPAIDEDLRGPVHLPLQHKSEGYFLMVTSSPVRSDRPLERGSVLGEIDVFDSELRKEEASLCNTQYKNAVAVLKSDGITVAEDQDARKSTANQEAFLDRTKRDENQSRSKWLNNAKMAIGMI